MLQHIGLYRPAVHGGLLDDGHVPDAAHGHVQGAGNGGGGQGEHIHIGGQLLEPFLLRHAEALLLVHDHQPQVPEGHILGQQAMGAHQDVHLAPSDPLDGLRLLFGRTEAGEHLHLYGKALKPADNRVVVLKSQDGGGYQHHALLALADALEGGA